MADTERKRLYRCAVRFPHVFAPLRRLRVEWLLAATLALFAVDARAMDEVMLKSGTRVSGTILAQSKDHVIMRIGDGNVVYSKKAIWRIYEDITDQLPFTRLTRPDELPPWWIPLSDLYHEDWVNELKAIPATSIGTGNFRDVPYLSFRANHIYEMNIYGDPMAPAAVEIGYYGNMWFHSHDAQKRCRQFIASYLTGLHQLEAIYRLNSAGGTQTVSGLGMSITPPNAPDAYGGWWVTVWNPARLAASRASTAAAWKAACERNLALIKKSTTGETQWTKYTIKEAAKRFLPLPRMDEK